MTRLWRAMTVALAVALVLGPASAAFATGGSGDDAGATDRGGNGIAVRAGGPESDVAPGRTTVPSETPRLERDRVGDDEADPERDRDRVRDQDRVREPECDRDVATDAVRDCRPADGEIRPVLARCIEFVQNETDHVIRRSLRWWWRVCHRLAWSHNNPE